MPSSGHNVWFMPSSGHNVWLMCVFHVVVDGARGGWALWAVDHQSYIWAIWPWKNRKRSLNFIISVLLLVSFPSSCFLAASASMAFRSSFASVPLQVTFAKGRKALTAITEHYVPCAAVRCSGYRYLCPSPRLNVAKQLDFLIRH